MTRRRRPPIQYPAMTSMLDLLFILVFAAIIQATALEGERGQANAAPAERALDIAPAVAVDAGAQAAGAVRPDDAAALHARAVDELEGLLRERRPVIARVSVDGRLRVIEVDGRTITLGESLVVADADRDVVLRYGGDLSPTRRLCARIVAALATADLSDRLVVIAPDRPLAEMSVALGRGLTTDAERCGAEWRGAATVIDPLPQESR